jgi:ankyrin repeat protein
MIRKSSIPKGHINKVDQEGFARIHLAVLDGNSVRALELLEEEDEKADPNVEVKHNQRTALHLAAKCTRRPKKCVNIAKLLIKHKASVDKIDSKKRTALHYACLKGNRAMVALLLENGAKLEVQDKDGNTPVDLDKEKLIVAYQESLQETAL